MKKTLLLLLAFSGVASAQRYTTEVFSQVTVTPDQRYATNIDFLTSDFSDQTQVVADVTALKTALATGQPIPAAFYNPADPSTDVKVTDLNADVYMPVGDTVTDRPLAIYIHTGNFLPPGLNGSINGSRKDSAAIVMCEKLAKRGFVAFSVDYRLGWNPLDPNQFVRRAQLLNAVYRSIHDIKELVRITKYNASVFGIDTNRIVLFGEGSGGYVALAYATLDKWAEVEIAKFINPATSQSFVDSNLVGNLEGLGGNLNLYRDNGYSTDVSMCVNMGGALADISWLEAGDPSMISIQCVRDPFAPFGNGTVVVPTTQDDVVDVSGANIFQLKANSLGNNNAWINNTYNDPITLAARARYGVTYPYIFPAPFDTITVANAEGLYPVIRPLAGSLFNNNGSPWQWWDPNGPIASDTLIAGPPVITYHMAGLASNPNMSPAFGRAYQDTILGYVTPRLIYQMNLIGTEEFNFNKSISMYPNPAQHTLSLELMDADLDLSSYEIMDNTGRMVSAGSLEGMKNDISIESLKPGVYFISVQTNRGSATSRFIKQ
ncbi:T9SS type A sorting domain-containing protein [Croceimicrobium hydrocarbonivorans]|uniref:T9SS type A sorting domain-containing protein n=1 Tax=Croceimicrobium hydrocarbonivorans TaxID=2761580 RepID=A0A7H0VE85_9FLAO|nr:T9SS type A sorting domain-containing protein [Croceimicrobium hydrocarbonivorans]QNR24033.1 T9SS type A sorting domain-containing protein [Croceimicrobium hydrocarbonivorans]